MLKPLLLASFTLLTACQLLPGGGPAEYQRQAWEQRQPGCQGEACSLVNVDTLHFPGEPVLDRLIERRLLEMTRLHADDPLPDSLRGYARQFLREAEPEHTSYLQAQVREQHGGLIVIELSSYLYAGGAHGLPGRGFIIYERSGDRELQLADLLLPGQEEAFWQLAAEAHQRWLVEKGHAEDKEFVAFWQFQPTRNIALLSDQVLLKYDVYSIAPYASGHPELVIPKDALRGVLKPKYL